MAERPSASLSPVPQACCVTLCVLLHLPSFVRLKMGTIYPGPKAALRFHYCKNLLELMPMYNPELLCIINRMWLKKKGNRGSNFSKAFLPLISPQTKAEPQQAPQNAWVHSVILDWIHSVTLTC